MNTKQFLIDALLNKNGGITPEGDIEINENGNYDVAKYATATVDVKSSAEVSNRLVVLPQMRSGLYVVIDVEKGQAYADCEQEDALIRYGGDCVFELTQEPNVILRVEGEDFAEYKIDEDGKFYLEDFRYGDKIIAEISKNDDRFIDIYYDRSESKIILQYHLEIETCPIETCISIDTDEEMHNVIGVHTAKCEGSSGGVNITGLSYMYYYGQRLDTLPPESVTTVGADRMDWCFFAASNAEYLDLSNWNTENVTNMAYMFYNCDKLKTVDLTNWDTNNALAMYNMFDGCYLIKDIYIRDTELNEQGQLKFKCADSNVWTYIRQRGGKIHLSATLESVYRTAPNWSNFTDILVFDQQ